MLAFNITEMFNTDTIGSIASLVILGFAAIMILSGLLWGLKRGFSKSVVRLLTVALAAVASFFMCRFALDWVDGFVEEKTLEEIIRTVYSGYDTIDVKYRNLIASVDTTTAYDLAKIVVALLVLPLAFVVFFLVIKAILFIIYAILSSVLGLVSYKKGLLSTLGGMAVGALQGALICAIILLPLAGFTTISSELRTPLTESSQSTSDEPDGTEGTGTAFTAEALYTEILDDVIESPVLTAINKLGGSLVFKSITTVKTDAGKIDMSAEAVSLVDVVFSFTELKGADFKQLSPESQQKLLDLNAKVADDAYLSGIVSGILRSVAKASDGGALTIPAPEPFDTLIKDSIGVFSTSDRTNLKGDIETILKVYFILSDHGVMASMEGGGSEELLDSLIKTDQDGNTAVSLIISEFEKNPRMSFMVSNLAKLSISIMADSMGLDADAQETYEEVKSDLKGALELNSSDFDSEEEYKAAVSNKVDEALKKQEIELGEEKIAGITDYIAENYSDTEEISDADIDSTLLSYYDAYLKSLENGEEPELPEGFPEIE